MYIYVFLEHVHNTRVHLIVSYILVLCFERIATYPPPQLGSIIGLNCWQYRTVYNNVRTYMLT